MRFFQTLLIHTGGLLPSRKEEVEQLEQRYSIVSAAKQRLG